MLFDILDSKKIAIDLPIISGNEVILYFDEYPMLFTGSNDNGDRIVGSLMCEDEETDVIRYLHLMVKNKDYIDFIARRISYRQLIEKQTNVFIIDRDEEDKVIETFYLPITDIPVNYLPHPDLLCPNAELVTGTEFTISLKGGIADIHEALMDAVRNVSKHGSQLWKDILEGIKIPGVLPELHQLAYSPTSFGINFRVKFTSRDMFFDAKSESALNEFVSSTIAYSLTHLPNEAQQLAKNQLEGTAYQKMIVAPFDKVYDVLHLRPDDKAKEKLLISIKKIPFELEKMTTELGKGFEYLEIKTHDVNSKTSQSIGVIDGKFSDQIAAAANIIESEGSKIEEDEDFTDYEIHVYHLNIEIRNGNAHIKNQNDKGKEIQDNPKLSFIGDGILTGSQFIDSMDTGEWITVKAKAKKINGRYKTLKIDFQ